MMYWKAHIHTDTYVGRRDALVTTCHQYLVVTGIITDALSELFYKGNYS